MPRAKAMRPAEVEWVDSKAQGSWRDADEYRNEQPAPCRSVGYVLTRDAKKIILLQSQSESGGVSDSITIPIGCVTKVRYLRA
jgi:hypothetical protein